jgi:hypothetical protein
MTIQADASAPSVSSSAEDAAQSELNQSAEPIHSPENDAQSEPLEQTAAPAPKPRGLIARGLRWPRMPVISFSLTIAAAGIGLLMGILPARAATLMPMVDTGVVLLFVPLCLLVVAILAEAVRLSLRGPLRIHEPRRVRTLSSWVPERS